MFTMMKEFESTEKNDFVSNGDDSLNLINILDTEDFYRNYDAITKENADEFIRLSNEENFQLQRKRELPRYHSIKVSF